MIWNKLMGEFIDVIEWTDDSSNTMVWRFERHGNEIKNGAQLTVRESQVAVFVNEGKIADIFGPGMYTLETKNLPILSTLQGWVHGFKSPFKAEIYFVNTRRFTDLKWGTKNPITLRDKEFGVIRLRAFGSYVLRVVDPGTFVREIVGTDSHFTTEEVSEQLRNMIVARLPGILAEGGIPMLDMAASQEQFGQFIANKLKPEFLGMGLELVQLLIENLSLPPEVEAALDKRTQMGVLGDLSKYQQFQAAEALAAAAKAPGGAAGQGMGLAMGMMMAQQVGGLLGGQNAPAGAATPPPLPQETSWYVAAGGQQQGPYPLAKLRELAAARQLTGDMLVWTQGMAAWTKAGEVAELAALLAAVPPPLPPA
jgi:membrane protease subunit (stomatin/prohibitin family)